ncbi:NmrA family NAD(P)-binding protein [Streptosporangium sp. CA-135522]|uniref:NmrA family NAD(P)-binding protein n=1 Tax=Streptosporangium sp. CA-135522 TaxID=3240072 RepID=UPI003D89D5E1
MKTIVVVGATGLQGRAVTAHLLADDWRIRAVTRDPNAPAARTLSQAGAQLLSAEMDDVAARDTAEQDR